MDRIDMLSSRLLRDRAASPAPANETRVGVPEARPGAGGESAGTPSVTDKGVRAPLISASRSRTQEAVSQILRGAAPGVRLPAQPDPELLADLVNEALVEQATRHGVDLS
jgi:hypothetical protein